MKTIEFIENLNIEKSINYRKEKDGENYTEMPQFRAGDSVNVAVRVIEGEKERIQNFKGIIISTRGAGLNKTFTIRKISNGVGVERIFPVYSPMIQSISVLKSGNVTKAKLYYLRGMSEKKIRQKLS